MQYHISIGSNLGDRKYYIDSAIKEMSRFSTRIKKSAIYETKAWGKTNQPDFLNAVVLIESDLNPLDLLKELQEIEKNNGRDRESKGYEHWGSRTLDLDILYAENLIFNEEGLIIPHPEIKNRRFVLIPLNEISPDFIDLKEKMTMNEMLKKCRDMLEVCQLKY